MFYYGLWGAANTLFTFIGGWVCDAVGARQALSISGLLSAMGFLLLAVTRTVNPQFWLSMYVLIPIGIGLGLPVCDVANRRLSTAANEFVVYPLAYSISTLGQCVGLGALAITAAIYFSESRRHDSEHEYVDYDSTVERVVLFVCAFASAVLCVVAFTMKATGSALAARDITLRTPDIESSDDEPPITQNSTRRWRLSNALSRTRENILSFQRNVTFRRVALLVFLTLPARHVFILLYTTLSLYIRRTLGVQVPVYAFMMIDPALEFVLSPLFALLMPQFDIFNMIVMGSFISSVGLLGFIVFEPTVLSICMTLAVFAVGSAMYVPRVPQYVLMLAPDGHEGQFAALASALPVFVGKIIVGLVFGSLLDKNCSAHSLADDCTRLWTPSVIASFCTPVLLLVFKRFIHTDEIRASFAKRLDVMCEMAARARSHENVIATRNVALTGVTSIFA